jgi:hypothetical protein
MPYTTNGHRDYKREEALYEKKHPERNKARVARNKARALVAKKKGIKPTSIKGDVGHRKAISKGGKSVLSNLFIQSPRNNRSFSRNSDSTMKSERSKNGC